MSEQKQANKTLSVKTNFVFNLCIQLLTYLIPLVLSPYLSRVLTPDGVGQNSYVNSIVSYFSLFVCFGFANYGNTFVAKQRNNKKEYSNTFWEIFFSRGLIFLIAFLVYLLMTLLWGFGDSDNSDLFIAYSLLLVFNFLDITFLFQGMENFRVVSFINIFIRVIGAVFVFLFVKSQDDLLIYVLIINSQSIIIALICWLFAIKRVDAPCFKSVHIGKCLKEAFFYFLPTIAISIYTILDRTMLGAMTSKQEVGYYEEAYKIVSLVIGLITALGPVMMANISRLVEEKKEAEIQNKIKQMGEVYFLIGFPSVAGLYAVSRYFIPAFFGSDYIPSINVIYYLIPLILIIPISNGIGAVYYVPRNKINLTTVFFFIGASVNLICNFFTIKSMGAQGAALTSVLSEIIISSLFIAFSWKNIDYFGIVKTGLKPLISSLVMIAILLPISFLVLDRYLESLIVKALIVIAIGVFTYGTMLLILREPLVFTTIHRIFRKKKENENA